MLNSQGGTVHCILLLDEVEIWRNHYNLKPIILHFENIDIYVAINPHSHMCPGDFNLELPEDTDITISRRLFHKHRNSFEISVFLSHMKKFFATRSIRIRALDDSDDGPLIDSCFVTGKRPILILTSNELSEEEILEAVKEDHIQPNYESVIVVYDDLELSRKNAISAWCEINHWSIVHCSNMIGTEASATILFELKDDSLEFYSRAKHCLVIIHK